MNNTKKCPYCGEEILTTAKKCKHCGEWLEKTPTKETATSSATSTINASFKEKIDHLATPIAKYVSWLYWIGIFALIVSLAYNSGDHNPYIGAGKTRIIAWLMLQVTTYIPEWIGTLADGVVESIFLYGLLIGLKNHSVPMEKSLIALIILVALGSFSGFITDEDIAGVFAIFIGLPAIILNSIVAIRLLVHYEGEMTKLGKYMLYSAGAVILGLAIAVLYDEWIVLLITQFVITYFEFYLLKIWSNLLGEKEE